MVHAPGMVGQSIQYINAVYQPTMSVYLCRSKIQIRTRNEGVDTGRKCCQNFEALIDLLNDYPDDIMFCSDDKHPDDLMLHTNLLGKTRLLTKVLTYLKYCVQLA